MDELKKIRIGSSGTGLIIDSFFPYARSELGISCLTVFKVGARAEWSVWMTFLDKGSWGVDWANWINWYRVSDMNFYGYKMDGLARWFYVDGVLGSKLWISAIVSVGEDVTNNVRTIKNVPPAAEVMAGFENFFCTVGQKDLRGEIVMLKRDLRSLIKAEISKRSALTLPTSAQFGCRGRFVIRSCAVAARRCIFAWYDVIRDDSSEVPDEQFLFTRPWLGARGFLAISKPQCLTICPTMKFVDEWSDKLHDLPFNTDGWLLRLTIERYT